MNWRLRLIDRTAIADQTIAVYFERPANLTFTAGQFVDLSLVNPPEMDDEGPTRTLTIASAPFEPRLMFALRYRDTAFKRVLQTMPLGSEVLIDEPTGAFTLHSDASRAAIFLAGGIGIAPFRSMICEAAHSGLARRLFLFYSNRRPEDVAFLEELHALKAANPDFQFIPTVTQLWRSRRQWADETCYIGPELIARYVGSLNGPMYYLAGPPAMVQSLLLALREAGVKQSDVSTDPFDGY